MPDFKKPSTYLMLLAALLTALLTADVFPVGSKVDQALTILGTILTTLGYQVSRKAAAPALTSVK